MSVSLSLEWDCNGNQKRCEQTLKECRMLLNLNIQGRKRETKTFLVLLAGDTVPPILSVSNQLAFLLAQSRSDYFSVSWRPSDTQDSFAQHCCHPVPFVFSLILRQGPYQSGVRAGWGPSPADGRRATDWVESCLSELRSRKKGRVAHQQWGSMLLCSKLCTMWKNMNENGQIAYNKLDLVAECFAGLTHGFWQHKKPE